MKVGSYVRIYFDGKGSSGETWEGLILNIFIDHMAKIRKDNNSRWISGTILMDGQPKSLNLYWDDDLEEILQ